MHVRNRIFAGLVVGAVTILGLPALSSQVASAAQPVPGHTRLVPSTPRTDVPRITNGEINDIEVIGNRVFIAGSFTSIANAGGAAINQPRLASYNLDTRRVDTTFRPTFDGGIAAIEASPDGTSLYVAGTFNTVGGQTRRKIVRINPTTGAPITAFTANANAQATALAVSNTTLYVGGQFKTVNGVTRNGLVALNRTTGAVDAGFNLPLSGGIGVGGQLTVQQLKLTHDDRKLMVVHTGRQIAGQDRYGVGLIDTATKALLPWRTRLWEENLAFVGGIQRIFAGDISPDDQYLVVSSGSGGDRPPINDTAMAFPVAGNDNVQPLWVSRHFDSVYSVAITETAVYVGGHFGWQESPTSPQPWPGLDNVGYGTGQGLSGYGLGEAVVRRDHLGALDPATGTALEWNPGSNSFEGEKAMEATSRGLIVGGDGNTKGGKSVGRVAFFDLAQNPAASAVETSIVNPIEGLVKAANTPFTIEGQATAPAGINRVQVEIKNVSSKQFLQDDLVTWGANNSINATVTVNATASPWSLPVSLPRGEYLIQAKTFGRNGTSDPVKATKTIEAFSFDDLPPTTRISSPSSGLLATQSFIATGSASDDVGVNALSFWFRNEDDLYLQEDGTVSASFNTFRGEPDVVGATSTTWSYEVNLPSEGLWRMSATAIDTSGQSDLRSDTRDWIISATGVPPTVTIATPIPVTPPTPTTPTMTVEPGSVLTFSGTATDEDRLKSVEVFLRNSTTREALASDGTWGPNVVAGFHRISPTNLDAATYNWSYTSVPLSAGVYDFRVQATDNLELTTSGSNQGRIRITVQVAGDAFPNGLLNFTGVDQNIDALHLDIAGTATDDFGVQGVRVSLRDLDTGRYLQPGGGLSGSFATLNATLASPGATSTSFLLPVDLPTKGEWSIEAFAVDTSGQLDGSTSGATARYLVYPGDLDPGLEAAGSPVNGEVYPDGRIVVTGRAIDDVGISRVDVQIVNSAGQGMNSAGTFSTPTTPGNWSRISAFLTSPGTPGSNFAYTSPVIPPGTYTVYVRATDNYGQVQQTPRVATVTVNAAPAP